MMICWMIFLGIFVLESNLIIIKILLPFPANKSFNQKPTFMRNVLFTCLLMVTSCTFFYGQDAKSEETKIDAFASKTGTIIKFIDYELPNIKLTMGAFAETKVRILISGSDTLYFYQIEKATQYSTKKASIEYSDLLEVIKALILLKEASLTDLAMKSDYLENKFVTEDGAQIGYYVSDGAIKWYIKLEKYGSDTTIFINDFALIEAAFNGAKTKIEELK